MALEGQPVHLETRPTEEFFTPSDMYCVGDDIFIISQNRQGNILYRYGSGLDFKGSYLHYGRSGSEFFFVDRSPCRQNDSTLFLYTDNVEKTELSIGPDTVTIASRRKIVPDLSNNVIELSPTRTFYRTLQEERPFCIYETSSGEKRYFGKFPDSPISFQTDEDRDNVSLSVSVYCDSLGILMSFYESMPVIEVYDMGTCGKISETLLTGVRPQDATIDEFYEGDSVIYFMRPVVSGGKVYVQMVNATGNESLSGSVLLEVGWDGTVLNRYDLDRDCPIYTVSEDGVFYGLSIEDGNYLLCKKGITYLSI